MDKITAININQQQKVLLEDMENLSSSSSINNQHIMPADVFPLADKTENVSFSQVMNKTVDEVNGLQNRANDLQNAIDTGQSDDLSTAMIESQKASVAFSAMMQVRNKLATALDEVMNTSL